MALNEAGVSRHRNPPERVPPTPIPALPVDGDPAVVWGARGRWPGWTHPSSGHLGPPRPTDEGTRPRVVPLCVRGAHGLQLRGSTWSGAPSLCCPPRRSQGDARLPQAPPVAAELCPRHPAHPAAIRVGPGKGSVPRVTGEEAEVLGLRLAWGPGHHPAGAQTSGS